MTLLPERPSDGALQKLQAPALPESLTQYAKTRVFNQDTIPAALMTEHRIGEASWGKIVILSGSMTYIRPGGLEERLKPGHPGFILPGEVHRVETDCPVSFLIEFYRVESRGP